MEKTEIFKKFECQAFDYFNNFDQIIPMISEHGIRGISVLPSQISYVKEAIKKSCPQNSPKIISVVDYPLGCQTQDTRVYEIASMKEKGADIVDIVAPYNILANEDINALRKDVVQIKQISKSCNIQVRYLLNAGCIYLNKKMKLALCQVLSNNDFEEVSVGMGYHSKSMDLSDEVLWMREIKQACRSDIKINLTDPSIEDISNAVKAGASHIGIEWKNAIPLIWEYSDTLTEQS